MAIKSEDRPFDISAAHYAHKWKAQTYPTEETNNLAVIYHTTENQEERERVTLELLKRFHSLFYKFMKLLVTGKPDFNNKYQKAFLRLFMSDAYKSSPHAYKEVANRCTIVFRNLTPDDIYDQLVIIFLNLLYRFNATLNVGFVYYINYFFKYHLKKFMVSRYYDALDYQYIDSTDISDSFISEEVGSDDKETGNHKLAAGVEQMHTDSTVEKELDEQIDLLSVTGTGKFKGMTTLERYIVYLLIFKGMKRVDVLELLDFSSTKLTTTLNKIKKKVGANFESLR